MKPCSSKLGNRFAFVVLGVLLSGCAGMREKLPELPADVAKERRERNAVIAEQFEEERSRAQFHAARSLFEQGNLSAARQQLQALLRRDPNCVDAIELMTKLDAGEMVSSGLGSNETCSQALPGEPRRHELTVGMLNHSGSYYPASCTPDAAPGLGPASPLRSASYQVPRDTASMAFLPPVLDEDSPANSPDVHRANPASYAAAVVPEAEISAQTGGPAVNSDSLWAVSPPHGRPNAVPASPAEINRQAVRLLRAAQPDAAVAVITQAVTDGNHSADLYRTLGLAHYRRGEYHLSQLALQQALSLDNRHPLSYFLMGFALAKLGDSEAADWHFRQAAALDARYVAKR